MKILKSLFLLCIVLLITLPSEAQVAKKLKRFEISMGLNGTKGHLKMTGATGFWINPHLVTHLFFLSPQRKTLVFEPGILRLEGVRMEKASIKPGSTGGLNFRIYQKPKSGLFAGLGGTRQSYLITAKSVFDNDYEPSYGNPRGNLLVAIISGGDNVVKEKTSANMWGINWQLGYAFPTKTGRFELLIRQNKILKKNRQYGYLILRSSNETKKRSAAKDFVLSPVGFEINYVVHLF